MASTNLQDFYNLVDVYLDAVLHPRCVKDPLVFAQEGWHYELDDKEVRVVRPERDCLRTDSCRLTAVCPGVGWLVPRSPHEVSPRPTPPARARPRLSSPRRRR